MGSPNCYTCQYRGTLLGDCHSRCRHPLVESALEGKESLVDLVSLLASGKRGGGADLSGPGSPWRLSARRWESRAILTG